MTIED
jgi:hypothetical protein